MSDEKKLYFMGSALQEARRAFDLGEVPVGAVIVKDNVIIARGYNQREMYSSVLEHAEINVIKKACEALGTWRLIGCTLYSTLEPCLMCSGAILHSRIEHVVFGAQDEKFGAVQSLYSCGQDKRLNHNFSHEFGVLEEECSLLMKLFFQNLRQKQRLRK